MTFTPGPERSAIYELLRYGRKHDGPWTEAIAGDQLIDEENADLYTAAPDMLVALKLALKQIKETQDALVGQGLQIAGWHLNGDLEPVESFFSDSDCGAVEAIEAAIAKAEGRTA